MRFSTRLDSIRSEEFDDDDFDCDSAPIMDEHHGKYRPEILVARDGKIAVHDNRTDSGFESLHSDFRSQFGIDRSQFGIDSKEIIEVHPKPHYDSRCDSGVILEKLAELNIKEEHTSPGKKQLSSCEWLGKEGCQNQVDVFQQDSDGDTILHLAIVQGFTEFLDEVLEKRSFDPAYLDIQNNLFQAPLHLAVLTGQYRIAVNLIKFGASLDLRDRYGNTALHLACRQGDLVCVEKLLSTQNSSCYGPYLVQDLELRNYDGQMCVHVATLGGHMDILKLLLQYGADINAQEGKGGRTPLHFAVEMNNIHLIKFLIYNCKASMDIPNFAGYLPIHLGYYADDIMFEGLLKCFKGMTSIPSLPISDSESESSSEEGMDISEFDFKVNGQLLIS